LVPGVLPRMVLGLMLRLVLGMMPSLSYAHSDNGGALGYGRKAFGATVARPSGAFGGSCGQILGLLFPVLAT